MKKLIRKIQVWWCWNVRWCAPKILATSGKRGK